METQATPKLMPPTSAKERELIAADAKMQLTRTVPSASEYEKFAFFNTIPRLIADVNALVEALERALPVVVEAHKMTHSQGTPTESCSRCEQIAADRAILNAAKEE